MTQVKLGLSRQSKASTKINSLPSPSLKPQVGKVYGVITTRNTPTKELFEAAGGFNGIGVVFYRLYNTSKNVEENIENIPKSIAFPLFPQVQNIPLIGELVYLIDLPGPVSLITSRQNTPSGNQKYYIPVNVWNSVQQNSLPSSDETSLGSTFVENDFIRHLIPYQGDYIIQGRQGSALRFSTTSRPATSPNEWSKTGNEDDPITILTNGLKFERTKPFYIERINKDDSALYLTSTQTIPLDTDKKGILNNLTNPKNVSDYINSQAIANADRVVLNSKKDEVMIFAETNVEINTNNVINLNADTRVHLNTDSVFLGRYDPNALPQPLLLGKETINLFSHLITSLNSLAGTLSKVISTPQGSPILDLNAAGTSLTADLSTAADLLKRIPSTRIFIAPDNAIQTNNQTPTSTNEEFQIIQTSYRSPIEQTVEETETPPTPPNVELKEEKVCPINFESTFGSGDPDFKNDPNTVNLLRQKVQELVTCIKQNQNNSNVKSIKIEIQGGESQVPNQEGYETVGSLANARRDNLINYLRKSLQSSLNIIPNIISLDFTLGTTPWTSQRFLDKNNKIPNPKFIPKDDQRFTNEQFVTATVVVTKEITTSTTTTTTTTFIKSAPCNFPSDGAKGGQAKKEKNYLFKENTIDISQVPNGKKILIAFAPLTLPDLITIETSEGIINSGFIGDSWFSPILATILGNTYKTGNIPDPFPKDIYKPEGIELEELWDEYSLRNNQVGVYKEWFEGIINIKSNDVRKIVREEITWYKFKKLSVRGGQLLKNQDFPGEFGENLYIIKKPNINSFTYRIYSPIGETQWNLKIRCID